jgi:hypothetical protein
MDFVSTFKPEDEIFKKQYLPPAKETKLSELRTISLPAEFLSDLPQSTRRSRRKGLRIAKEGLAGQKLERLKRLRKELGDRILDEEVKTDDKKSKVKAVRSTNNEGTFKTPSQFTPTKKGTSTSGSRPGSLSMSGSTQANQSSPGLDQRMDSISLGFKV